MKIYPYLSFAASPLLLTVTLVLAQSMPATGTAVKTKPAATSTVQPSAPANNQIKGRQDQFGHVSGAANTAGTPSTSVQPEAKSRALCMRRSR